MRVRRLVIGTVLGLSGLAVPLGAHHSMGTYDQSVLVTIRGTISRLEWRNPHTWVVLTVLTPDGKTASQRVEIAGPSRLQRTGFDRSLLAIGDTITIQAWLLKPQYGGDAPNGRTLTLSDGRRFDVGDNWPEK